MDGTEEQPPITALEERELRRVYETLCSYVRKKDLRAALQPRHERIEELSASLENISSTQAQAEIMDDSITSSSTNGMQPGVGGNGAAAGGTAGGRGSGGGSAAGLGGARGSLARAAADQDAAEAAAARAAKGHELAGLRAAARALEEELDQVENDRDRKISVDDLCEALKFLGTRRSKREVEDMVWEVDENLDGCIEWSEFLLMFQRNIFDRTGLEPSQLYHMVQFMMYDLQNTGRVKLDDTLDMMYARHRSNHWKKVEELFPRGAGGAVGAEGGGAITFQQYLGHAEKTQKEMFELREREKKMGKNNA